MESICSTLCLIIFCLLIRKSIREGRQIKAPPFYSSLQAQGPVPPSQGSSVTNTAALSHGPANDHPPRSPGDAPSYLQAGALLLDVLLVT